VIVAIVSDTHLPRAGRVFPDRCVELMESADLILHAGDFIDPIVLAEMEILGPPVKAVYGNMDLPELQRELPPEVELDLEDARLAMLHDAGPAPGRIERMRRRFPDADALVFGHSHTPLIEERDGFQIFNPGSPTDKRRAPHHTMGLARVEGGRISFEHVALD
jgi:uncharacterized protein